MFSFFSLTSFVSFLSPPLQSDPLGREFWSANFSDLDEVAFDLFQQHFMKNFRVVTNEIGMECLHAVMGDMVTLESFNKCLSFFGPLEPKGQDIVERIACMCEKPFFHGDIGKDEAVKLLSRQKKGFSPLFSLSLLFLQSNQAIIAGCFLVRFSGTQHQEGLGNYALSMKKKVGGGVSHIRLTGGGGTVCDNLERFIKLNKKELGLKHACPGSRFLFLAFICLWKISHLSLTLLFSKGTSISLRKRRWKSL